MPRRPRQYLPGMPYHVRQRGNNREACFHHPDDRLIYLDLLGSALKRYEVSLHAFVLMTNHVHLLMTPQDGEGISQVMKVVASRYAYHMNKSYQRTGTLWEGRHKSSVVDTDKYLLTCYRYIEMNPVAAHMVNTPEQYPWSSYSFNALGQEDDLVTPHAIYLALGKTPAERLASYQDLFDDRISLNEVEKIRKALHYCLPLGEDAFCSEVEKRLGRKLGQAKRGRPRKGID